ncbi:MAG: cysteine-rich small domain-containing protein [Coriobacteriales bacterium]|jgi:Zn-finger protein|nr:cysteine-rich small domain-containing protein [Coriobacteriales bacterium]
MDNETNGVADEVAGGEVADDEAYVDDGNWRGKNYSFFAHTSCEYFPCHDNASPDDFSCLFCFCPLYLLGTECGGNYVYTKKGVKSCHKCLVPHKSKNYGLIIERYMNSKEMRHARIKR